MSTTVKHRDALNRPLAVGDKIVFAYSSGPSSSYMSSIHTITRFTSCYVWVKQMETSCEFRVKPSKAVYIEDQIESNTQQFPEMFL